MATNQSGSRGGVGFLGLLTLLFIGLKLCNVIAWSWWAVLSPLWAPLAVLVGVVGVVFFGWLTLFVSVLLFRLAAGQNAKRIRRKLARTERQKQVR